MPKLSNPKRTYASLIGLLLVCLIPLFALIDGIGQRLHKSEVHQTLVSQLTTCAEEKLDTLFFNVSDYHQFAYHDEIEWNGNMYDVVSVKPVPGGYMVYAYNDSLDQQFNQTLALATQESESEGTASKNHGNYLKLQWYQSLDFESALSILVFDISNAPWDQKYDFTPLGSIFHPPQLS